MNKEAINLSNNLKYLREINKETQDDIAKLVNKQNTAVSNWEKGIREPDAVDLMKLAQHFDVSIDDLVISNLKSDNAEVYETKTIETIKIPVLGTIKAGTPIEAQEDILEYIDIPKNWTRGEKVFYGLKISGDSMYPKYQSNDVVIFEKSEDISRANGKDCAIMVNGYDATFKKFTLNENGIILTPLNQDNSDGFQTTFYNIEQVMNLPVKIVGIAIEKRTRL